MPGTKRHEYLNLLKKMVREDKPQCNSQDLISISRNERIKQFEEDQLNIVQDLDQFKRKINYKFQNSSMNREYNFERLESFDSENSICDSLEEVSIYDLHKQNHKNQIEDLDKLVELICYLKQFDKPYIYSLFGRDSKILDLTYDLVTSVSNSIHNKDRPTKKKK